MLTPTVCDDHSAQHSTVYRRPSLLIYLDFNRTTPLAPSVLEAMAPYWSTHFMLPDQEHPQAQAVAEAIEHAREGLAMLVGCESFEIVFTGGGTEANNLALLGIAGNRSTGRLLLGPCEHDSVAAAALALADRGWSIQTLPHDDQGVVDVDAAAGQLDRPTDLVCLQRANPVTGVIQPIRALADVCHHRGAAIHCDATQSLGKIPIDAGQLRIDTLSISGHKFYGPKGSGALFVRRGFPIRPIGFGEPREMGLRPGTENVPGCVGLGAAASLAAKCVGEAELKLRELRDQFSNGLDSSLDGSAIELGIDAERLPNTAAFELPGDAHRVQRAARHLALATALSGDPPDEITRTLRAIGRSDRQIGRTVRISLGWTTSAEQVDRAVRLLAEAADLLRD